MGNEGTDWDVMQPFDLSEEATLATTSPASGSPVSGTAIQLAAADNQGLASLQVFVSAKGSAEPGIALGSAQEPYGLSWDTSGQPTSDLDLVAVAKDYGANEAESAAVALKTQSSGLPSLQLLTAFTLVPDKRVAVLVGGRVAEFVQAEDVLPPESPDLPPLYRSQS